MPFTPPLYHSLAKLNWWQIGIFVKPSITHNFKIPTYKCSYLFHPIMLYFHDVEFIKCGIKCAFVCGYA